MNEQEQDHGTIKNALAPAGQVERVVIYDQQLHELLLKRKEVQSAEKKLTNEINVLKSKIKTINSAQYKEKIEQTKRETFARNIEISRLYINGEKLALIAEKFKISVTTVRSSYKRIIKISLHPDYTPDEKYAYNNEINSVRENKEYWLNQIIKVENKLSI